MAPNRVVVALTPLVFAPLAGAVSATAAKYFPGLDIPASRLEEIFIAGALIALAPVAQWLKGHQLFEAREAAREDRAQELDAREAIVAAREQEFTVPEGTLDEDLLPADDDSLAADDDLLPADDELDLDFDLDAVDDAETVER